jgi:4-hydroxybenzoate polyprenyltransferase
MQRIVADVFRRARALLTAMRPVHWVKNGVVFAAPLFALVLEPAPWLRVGWAFVAFSATASAFYLVNDVRDAEADRRHPVKRHRPIAAGRLSAPAALVAAAGLLGLGLAGSYAVRPALAAVLGGYAVLQAGYNLGLKEQPILDIMVIAGGFVLRAVAGAVAAGVPPSDWFLLCVGLLAFFLGVEKRKAELETADDAETRGVLAAYTRSWLDRMEGVVTASALMAYALWTLEGAGTPWMLATIPFVAYAIFRYQYLSEHGHGESPESTLAGDPPLVVTVLLWAAVSLAILLTSG